MDALNARWMSTMSPKHRPAGSTPAKGIFENESEVLAFLKHMAASINCLTIEKHYGVGGWLVAFIGTERRAWVGVIADVAEFIVIYSDQSYRFPLADPNFVGALEKWLHGETDLLHGVILRDNRGTQWWGSFPET